MEPQRTREEGRAEPPPASASGRQPAGGPTVGALALILVVGLATSGSFLLEGRRTGTDIDFVLTGQAGQFARSGIREALNWFRLQPAQPVLSFDPDPETAADPLRGEDRDVGLVREFRIDGDHWGRYEVWRPWQGDPVANRRAWRDQMSVQDTSLQRGLPPGSVWRIRCVGYVYEQHDPQRSFRRYPNRVLGSRVLEAEIRRLRVTLPAAAALSVRDGGNLEIGEGCRILGGSDGAGIAFPRTARTPPIDALRARVGGVQRMAPVPTWQDRIEHVFGTNPAGLRAMADMVLADPLELPLPVPEHSLVFSRGQPLRLDRPLLGSGLFVHLGDLELADGAAFEGLIYVDGDLRIRGDGEIRGAVVATGSVILEGAVTLRYERRLLDEVRQRIGQYRLAGPFRAAAPTR